MAGIWPSPEDWPALPELPRACDPRCVLTRSISDSERGCLERCSLLSVPTGAGELGDNSWVQLATIQGGGYILYEVPSHFQACHRKLVMRLAPK